MDLNPLAFEPSASIPDIPYTDLSEILKMYGDAEDTVSVSRLTVAFKRLLVKLRTRDDGVEILE